MIHNSIAFLYPFGLVESLETCAILHRIIVGIMSDHFSTLNSFLPFFSLELLFRTYYCHCCLSYQCSEFPKLLSDFSFILSSGCCPCLFECFTYLIKFYYLHLPHHHHLSQQLLHLNNQLTVFLYLPSKSNCEKLTLG